MRDHHHTGRHFAGRAADTRVEQIPGSGDVQRHPMDLSLPNPFGGTDEPRRLLRLRDAGADDDEDEA